MFIGDKVKFNDKYYVLEEDKDKVFTVKSDVKDICGTLCLKITEKGYYPLDGLTVVGESDTE